METNAQNVAAPSAPSPRGIPGQLSPFWMLFLLTGLNLFNYLDRYIVSAVLTPIRDDFRVGDTDLGRINTIFMIGYFITSPVFGYLGDRASRKWLIAAGIFIWSIGTVLTGYAATFAWLLFYRVLVGVGEASYATISPSLISDVFPPARRNNALTIFYVAIPVGAALGNILGGHIAATHGWRNAFIWAGVPGLFLALILLPFRDPPRGAAEGARVAKPGVAEILGLFRLGKFNLVLWGYAAYTFALGAFGVWGPTYLHRAHAVPIESAATFFGAVLVVAGLLGTFAGGFAATAWQKRNPRGYAWVLFLSVALAVPFAVAAFLVSGKTASMTSLGIAIFLLFLCTGPVNTVIIESVPVNLRASAMAISIFVIHMFGDMWSSEIVGRLSDSLGSLQKAVMILPGALAIGAFFWLALVLKSGTARFSLVKEPSGA